MGIRFPGESVEYRAARERLLEKEIEPRGAMEVVAAARRELPPDGPVKHDYVFHWAGADGAPRDVPLSELFEAGKDSLVIYSFMFPRDTACQPEAQLSTRLASDTTSNTPRSNWLAWNAIASSSTTASGTPAAPIRRSALSKR